MQISWTLEQQIIYFSSTSTDFPQPTKMSLIVVELMGRPQYFSFANTKIYAGNIKKISKSKCVNTFFAHIKTCPHER
jgi:hypothetical protein